MTGTRAFDRSLSSGGSWYTDRSASNGPASAGIIGPGGPAEDGTNNGSMSPRYTKFLIILMLSIRLIPFS